MSRIDDALRRAGASGSTTIDRLNPDSVFSSAWEFGDRRVPRDIHAAAATATPEIAAGVAALPRSPRLVAMAGFVGFSHEWQTRLVSPASDPALAAQFRRLAAALLDGRRSGSLKTVMVTSAEPADGKTLTALNLALVLSGSYQRRVLIIDADLRHPRISEAANLVVSEGLSEALTAPDERKVSLVQLTENLMLLPAGKPTPDPLSGLTSSRMQQVLEEAAERFDWVIIDTAPVEVAPDPGLLCAMVDATVLVVRAGQTPHAAVQRAVQTIGHERIFGVVLNGVNKKGIPAYADYDPATTNQG
jgi:protein-tyrosine kinase